MKKTTQLSNKGVQLLEEIREVNLSYLMLAQQLVRDDKETAMFRLGVSEEVAELIERLTPGQLLKMAATNTLLCGFRFDDAAIINMMTGAAKDRQAASTHAAILLAGMPVQGLQ